MKFQIIAVLLLGAVVLAAAQGGLRRRGGQGRNVTPEERQQRRERFLARVFPDGVPENIRNLLAQGTEEATRQAWALVRQAWRERNPNGGRGRGNRLGLTEDQRQQRSNEFLARIFPEGVPQNIQDLLAQGTSEATRQAWQLIIQAARERGVIPQRGPRRQGPGN